MATYHTPRIARVAACAMVVLFSSATSALAQVERLPASEVEALSVAAKASPELVNGLAKELGSSPEQAAGAAAVLFTLAKSFTTPEDFAALSKSIPGMEALLAATPASLMGPSAGAPPSPSRLTPGFASSSQSGTMTADGVTSAAAGISNLGIKPEMIVKALPFLSGFLKKYGGAALGSLLETLFKAGKPGQ